MLWRTTQIRTNSFYIVHCTGITWNITQKHRGCKDSALNWLGGGYSTKHIGLKVNKDKY